MSFIIAVHVKEGIVLASDSRTTYTQTIQNNNITTVKLVHILRIPRTRLFVLK